MLEYMHKWYPATIALYQIGKPALPALVQLLGTETSPIVRAKALQTVMDISSDGFHFVSGVKLLQAAALSQGDSRVKARLLDAASKAVKMCPVPLRPQCEDALH